MGTAVFVFLLGIAVPVNSPAEHLDTEERLHPEHQLSIICCVGLGLVLASDSEQVFRNSRGEVKT